MKHKKARKQFAEDKQTKGHGLLETMSCGLDETKITLVQMVSSSVWGGNQVRICITMNRFLTYSHR